MFGAFRLALVQLPEKKFRSVLLRSLGLTIVLFALFWAGALFAWPAEGFIGIGWMDKALDWAAGFLGVGAMFVLLIPVASMFVAIFLDEIAEAVEQRFYAHDADGREQPLSEAILVGLKFTALVIVLNILILPFYLIGIGFIAFFLLNGYLIGREYFEMVGVRHKPIGEVKQLRRAHGATVFIAGVMVAVLLTIPIVNFIVPVLGTAFMVHIYKRVVGSVPAKVVPA